MQSAQPAQSDPGSRDLRAALIRWAGPADDRGMKRGTLIRFGCMTVGLCLSLWQAPKLIDRALGLKDSAGEGMFGFDPAALLGGACEQSACGTEKPGTEEGGLVIFTPQGENLSDADREERVEVPTAVGVAPGRAERQRQRGDRESEAFHGSVLTM